MFFIDWMVDLGKLCVWFDSLYNFSFLDTEYDYFPRESDCY